MRRINKVEQENIEEKLSKIKLDLDNIPNIFEQNEKITYKPLQRYDNTNYKVYHYVDIKNIEIYLTPTTRLEETSKKYKLAKPLINYLQRNNEEYAEFKKMLENLDTEKLEHIEKMQKQFQKHGEPFGVKYDENPTWSIYYSEQEKRYFMMFPTKETEVEPFFFIIKKQIELQRTRRKELIYVPINNMQYSSEILKKSEIADLENYLWYFTKEWPAIYEVKQKDETNSLQVVGKVEVYDKIKSTYKMSFTSKNETAEYFKLIKALFTIKSNAEEEYPFQTAINENAELCFYFNHNLLTNENLNNFIKTEIENKKQKIVDINNKNMLNSEKLELLKETISKQNLEYLSKEKQIVTFLECKKTFFGKLSYFFKSKKKNKKEVPLKKEKVVEEIIENKSEESFKETEKGTIEDLLKICTKLQEKMQELKNKELEIKTLENKSENLDRKIKNATIYINEIESHKKSIFDFWKFTNKDEQPLLTEAEEQEKTENKENIKNVFSYEKDIEEIGKKIDLKQRNTFSDIECDAIFAIYQDIDTFIIDRKEKKLKKDEKIIEKNLKQMQLEYENVNENLNQRDKYKILDIHFTTTVEQYKDNIHQYSKILEEAYPKMTSPCDMKVYKADKTEIKDNTWNIMNMDIKSEIKKYCDEKCESFVLSCINIKENMPAIFYSNIIFCPSLSEVSQEGMNKSQMVLVDLAQYEIKLTGRKDFNINVQKNEFENEVKLVQVYEYSIERKDIKND